MGQPNRFIHRRSMMMACTGQIVSSGAIVPRGPRGEKRPADVIGNAVKIMRIATGEEEEELDRAKSAAAELGARGGKARAAKMSPEQRAEIARKAARQRWKKP
jgi:hypothetical protein